MRDGLEYEAADEELVCAVLAECILGRREAVELRMDLSGMLARMSIAHRIQVVDIGRILMPQMRRSVEAVIRAFKSVPDAGAGLVPECHRGNYRPNWIGPRGIA